VSSFNLARSDPGGERADPDGERLLERDVDYSIDYDIGR